jgi:NifB/MoaA-like Fe-S oxidoreductase
MTTICSCGHQANPDYYNVIEKSYDKYGNACLAYKTVCRDCYITSDRFESEDDAYKWLAQQEVAIDPF